MDYNFYKLFHIFGIFLVLLSLGAMAGHMLQGGSRDHFSRRRFFSRIHGVGALVAFISGFGLIARGGFSLGEGWLIFKMGAWLILGLFPLVLYKGKRPLLSFVALLGLLLSVLYVVEYKPF